MASHEASALSAVIVKRFISRTMKIEVRTYEMVQAEESVLTAAIA